MTINLSLDHQENKHHQNQIQKSLPKKMKKRLPLSLRLQKSLVKI